MHILEKTIFIAIYYFAAYIMLPLNQALSHSSSFVLFTLFLLSFSIKPCSSFYFTLHLEHTLFSCYRKMQLFHQNGIFFIITVKLLIIIHKPLVITSLCLSQNAIAASSLLSSFCFDFIFLLSKKTDLNALWMLWIHWCMLLTVHKMYLK